MENSTLIPPESHIEILLKSITKEASFVILIIIIDYYYWLLLLSVLKLRESG